MLILLVVMIVIDLEMFHVWLFQTPYIPNANKHNEVYLFRCVNNLRCFLIVAFYLD